MTDNHRPVVNSARGNKRSHILEEEIFFSYSVFVMLKVEKENEISSSPKAIGSFLMRKKKEEEISFFSSSIATSFGSTKEEEQE